MNTISRATVFRILALIAIALLVAVVSQPYRADELADRILPLREQARIKDEVLEDRLDNVVPLVMRRAGVDAWVLIAREYNEDPVLKTMLPATWLNARRRTVLLFIDHGPERGVERMAVARYAVGDLFPGAWNPEQQPDQYARIAQILSEFNPQSIALNFSDTYGLADGLTFSEQRDFLAALPTRLQERVVSSQDVAVGWLETRTELELELYRDVMQIAHDIIKEGFSAEVVEPGVTTTEDLEWWFRQRVNDLGLSTWFHTSIETERSDRSVQEISDGNLDPDVLYKGDHIHIDFGISYLNLQTDTQQNAYILRDDEDDVPEDLKFALQKGNELQDILTDNFAVGRTGNEILRRSREQAIERDIGPIIYTHPIGYHGHAAGTTLGMWDSQGGVPHTGDYPLHLNTAYSIELNAATYIEEWGKEIRIMLEEEAYFDANGVNYIDGRQKELILIGSRFGVNR